MMKNPIGVLIAYRDNMDLAAEFRKAQEMGLESCQLCIWNEKYYAKEYALACKAALEETGFRITTVWAGWSGPCEWNFTLGPSTIGLVPPAYRAARTEALKMASDFALVIGVPYIATHVGFLPDCPNHPDFIGTVAALRHVCRYMAPRGQKFLFETGQETPMTIVRAIEAIGTSNCGINFDTANLILYGNGNSLDALDMFGQYVLDTHIKDGFYPTDCNFTGRQVPIGEGRANIPAILKKLRELGYEGALTIEREISGEQQKKDIAAAREFLLSHMAEIE